MSSITRKIYTADQYTLATTLSPRSDNIQYLCPKTSKTLLDTTPKSIRMIPYQKDLISKLLQVLEMPRESRPCLDTPTQKGRWQLALPKIKSKFKPRK